MAKIIIDTDDMYQNAEISVMNQFHFNAIPKGMTLKKMLDLFVIEMRLARNYKINGIIKGDDSANKLIYKPISVDNIFDIVSKAQRSGILLQRTNEEIFEVDQSDILLLDSLSFMAWASKKYGECYYDLKTKTLLDEKSIPANARWKDITIKIRKNHKISYKYATQKDVIEEFSSVGLLDLKTKAMTHQANILLGLSRNMKYPPEQIGNSQEIKHLLPKYKTAISKLRKSLKTLTGIQEDPFLKFHRINGWKPRFKLIDLTKDADIRARKSDEIMSSTMKKDFNPDDSISYDKFDDATDTWITDQENKERIDNQ